MPNGPEHRAVGILAGGMAGAVFSIDQDWPDMVVEILGAVLGGIIGAALPDKFDPPTSPNHRAIAHGVLTAGGGLTVCAINTAKWQGALRDKAATSNDANQPYLAFGYRLAAGFSVGLIAAYGSHLLMDAQTPRGLPLVS